MQFLYAVHGLVLGCEFALPELDAVRREPPLRPDVRIALAELPADPGPIAGQVIFFHADGGNGTLAVPGVARYLVRDGHEVLIEPERGADPSHVRLFLLGSVMGHICHQRGSLPLHASAVAVDGAAIAFVGHPGAGKSTLAAHCLACAPASLMADDILVVSSDRVGYPLAHPGMPSLKLWRDALELLGRGAGDLRPDWLRAEKFHLPMSERLGQSPLPLIRVYVLEDDPKAGAARIEAIGGAAAAAALIAYTYRVEHLNSAAQRPPHFAISARLAGNVAVRRLARCRDPAYLRITAAAVFADAFSAMQPAQ
jgi:hypothetical protein